MFSSCTSCVWSICWCVPVTSASVITSSGPGKDALFTVFFCQVSQTLACQRCVFIEQRVFFSPPPCFLLYLLLSRLCTYLFLSGVPAVFLFSLRTGPHLSPCHLLLLSYMLCVFSAICAVGHRAVFLNETLVCAQHWPSPCHAICQCCSLSSKKQHCCGIHLSVCTHTHAHIHTYAKPVRTDMLLLASEELRTVLLDLCLTLWSSVPAVCVRAWEVGIIPVARAPPVLDPLFTSVLLLRLWCCPALSLFICC